MMGESKMENIKIFQGLSKESLKRVELALKKEYILQEILFLKRVIEAKSFT